MKILKFPHHKGWGGLYSTTSRSTWFFRARKGEDKKVEITPKNIRLRKVYLTDSDRKKNGVKK